MHFEHGDRGPRRDFDGVTGIIDRDENDCALRGLKCFGPGGVAGVHRDEYVHTATPGVDDAGVQLDEFTDADEPVEVKASDVGGDAVAATPLRGGGVGRLADPFK